MGALTRFFELRTGTTKLTLEQQKKAWLGEFLKTYAVLIVVYGGFYLLRTNFKAAQPLLKEQAGLSTAELGTIGFAFSLTYGFGGLILGFLCDGRNTKRILGFLLVSAGVGERAGRWGAC